MKLVGRRASAELSLEKERDQDGKDKPGVESSTVW